MSIFDEKDYPIEISYSKYMTMSVGALRTLCSKYGIEFYFGTKKRDLAMNIIPNAFANDDVLERFFNNLSPREQKILRYIVHYQGYNLRLDIKKQFKFDIVSLIKGGREIYVWWLELLLDREQMDEDIKYYFLSFLDEASEKGQLPEKPGVTHATFAGIDRVKVDKFDWSGQSVSQKLISYEAEDIASAIRIIYRLAKDSRIKVTKKGSLTVRSDKLLQENLSIGSFDYIMLLNHLIDIKYLTPPQLKLPTKAFDTAVSQDDGALVKTLFKKFMSKKKQWEFSYFIFRIQPWEGALISRLRETVIDIVKKSSNLEWISIDHIVDQIPINKKTLKQITNGYDYCYNFDPQGYYHNYNKINHLKIVIRYFVKSFIGISHNLGLFDIARTEEDSFTLEDLDLLNSYYSSPFASIEYAKISGLGRFVLDIDKEYKSKKNFSLILNPYSCDITVEKPNALSALFLSQISTEVGENKYHTDIKIFMRGIDSPKAYEMIKKSFFESCDTIPPCWKKLFETMDERSAAAEVVSTTAILVEIKNPEVIRQIITSDARLQTKVLKADKLHIVIRKEELAYVKRIFKEYGVIL